MVSCSQPARLDSFSDMRSNFVLYQNIYKVVGFYVIHLEYCARCRPYSWHEALIPSI